VAKASAEGGATLYVAEGDDVPQDVSPEVRLVGPGVPAQDAAAAAAAAPDAAVQELPDTPVTQVPDEPAETPSEPQGDEDDDDGPADWGAYPIRVLRDVCREKGLSPTGAKADLVAALTAWDEQHSAA
jgi:hypothetical protein